MSASKTLIATVIFLTASLTLTSQSANSTFADLDAAVRALPRQASIPALAEALGTIAASDEEKVRAVYIWLTKNIAYDADSFFSGRRAVTDAAGVFRTGKSVCQGYSELFVDLCQRLGLEEVALISGYAKAYSYSPGQRFRDSNHAWNAVRIDGRWRLFDATWGAGHVDGRRFVREYDEFWYDTDPRLFLINHLPEESEWQFVEQPITLAQYESIPLLETYVLSALWNLGFPADEIVRLYASKAAMVEAYDTGANPVRILEAPLDGELESGQEYQFRIHAPGMKRVALINNSQWTYLVEKDGFFTASIRPTKGKLNLNIEYSRDGRKSFWGVLGYVVK